MSSVLLYTVKRYRKYIYELTLESSKVIISI